jgi:hypothetical protein
MHGEMAMTEGNEKLMRRRHAHLLFLLGLAVVVGSEIYLRFNYGSIARSVAFLLWLGASASFVGAIPRKARTQQAQIVCSIIGWPMFVTFLALMVVSVWGMVDTDGPGYMLLIGFLWVLAHLTWKIFIHPTIKGSNSN